MKAIHDQSSKLGLLVGIWFLFASSQVVADRPNIVWLLSEDNSIHYMQHYGSQHGPTPSISALAGDGLTFRHAFSNSPVCSVARTTLMTGMFGPRIGFHYHRKITPVQLPANASMFPVTLRKHGYYCTNNVKTDYNVVTQKVWDASSKNASWRNRPNPDQPFFHMQSFGQSHESSLHFRAQQMDLKTLETDPGAVTVFPYHPDTPEFRYTYARYHDRMTVVDSVIGNVIDQLKKDGLYENTIIFYFGDHGGVLPRSKGYLYESGLHVPLIIRVPEKWKSLCPWQPGTRIDGFVSFIDFAPTVLRLAGAEIPASMDGSPFLGSGVSIRQIASQDETYGYADRFDERYELVRSVRKGDFKYIRNYENFYPDSLQNNYRYRMIAFQQWRALNGKGQLNEAQSHFFQAKPAESLYHLPTDPHEVHNLAADPEYQKQLKALRQSLQAHVKQTHDLSFYPENQMLELASQDGAAFGIAHQDEIDQLIDIADLALLPVEQARQGISRAIRSRNPRARFWAMTACASLGAEAIQFSDAAQKLLDDSDDLVRVRAAEFLGILKHADPCPTLVDVLATNPSGTVAAITLNAVVFLQDYHGYEFKLDASQIRGAAEPLVQRRLEYLNKN